MSLNNLSYLPDSYYTTVTSGSLNGSLVDPSSNIVANPYKWVSTYTDLSINPVPKPSKLSDISQNVASLAGFLEYGKALFSEPSLGTKIPTNYGKPLGNRYFVYAAGKRCIGPDGTDVSQNYVVDGMAPFQGSYADISNVFDISTVDLSNNYVMDNMMRFNGAPLNGLAFSAQGSLQYVDPSNITMLYSLSGEGLETGNVIVIHKPTNPMDYNMCVKAKIVTDGSGNTATDYVSRRDFADLKSRGIATEGFYSATSSQRLVRGHSGQWGTDFGGYVIGDDIAPTITPHYFHAKHIVAPSDMKPIASVAAATTASTSTATTTPNILYNVIADDDDEDAKYRRELRYRSQLKTREVYDDIITGFFIGSISVLGLIILFRLLDRSASRIRKP